MEILLFINDYFYEIYFSFMACEIKFIPDLVNLKQW